MPNQHIIIYAAPTHSSVEIGNGASRTTRGKDFPAIIAAMHPEDRAVLATFCTGILAMLQTDAPAIKGGRQ